MMELVCSKMFLDAPEGGWDNSTWHSALIQLLLELLWTLALRYWLSDRWSSKTQRLLSVLRFVIYSLWLVRGNSTVGKRQNAMLVLFIGMTKAVEQSSACRSMDSNSVGQYEAYQSGNTLLAWSVYYNVLFRLVTQLTISSLPTFAHTTAAPAALANILKSWIHSALASIIPSNFILCSVEVAPHSSFVDTDLLPFRNACCYP